MAWHLNLGIDKDVLRDTAPEQREPELFRPGSEPSLTGRRNREGMAAAAELPVV